MDVSWVAMFDAGWRWMSLAARRLLRRRVSGFEMEPLYIVVERRATRPQ